MKISKPSQNGKEGLRKGSKAQKSHKLKNSPLDKYYHISSLNHPVSKEFNQLCAHTLPLWQ
jgi:hypothetical protein